MSGPLSWARPKDMTSHDLTAADAVHDLLALPGVAYPESVVEEARWWASQYPTSYFTLVRVGALAWHGKPTAKLDVDGLTSWFNREGPSVLVKVWAQMLSREEWDAYIATFLDEVGSLHERMLWALDPKRKVKDAALEHSILDSIRRTREELWLAEAVLLLGCPHDESRDVRGFWILEDPLRTIDLLAWKRRKKLKAHKTTDEFLLRNWDPACWWGNESPDFTFSPRPEANSCSA